MNKKVASLESQMDARVNEAMHLCSEPAKDHCWVAAGCCDKLASQRRRSCASTAAPDVPAEHPKIEAAAEERQRYPVDDITMTTACELHVGAKIYLFM